MGKNDYFKRHKYSCDIAGYAILKVYPEYAYDRPPEADKPIKDG
jgi:hypothetical protein